MDMKASFMGGLCLKPTPKIVTKSDGKHHKNRHKTSSDTKHSHHRSTTNLNSINSMINSPSSVLSDNSLNQLSSASQSKNQNNQLHKNKIQFIKHTENIIIKPANPANKSVSLLQKYPVKMQSLLQKRSILNAMNSNLIANQYNSSNLLINSLMKTTVHSSNNLNQPEKSNDTNRVDDKMIKVIKLCVSRLEFSSPLFRRIATKMSFLYFKPTYEQIRNYERFCSTSNKAVLKQVMNKAHTLKYKPSRNRSRMLRSNEIVDGKLMISWQRSNYVHVYTFNRRQRLRRYSQISGEHRTLQIMYGMKKVTLPKIIECPHCKKTINPNFHYCVVSRKPKLVKRFRSSNTLSLLKRNQVQLNDHIQTSDYVSNESDNSSDLTFNQYTNTTSDRRNLLEDSAQISMHKLSGGLMNEEELSMRCPTLLLDSSNYKTSQNSISNVIVRRMDSKELSKQVNQQRNESNGLRMNDGDKLQVKKVNAQVTRSLMRDIKCSVMKNQHSSFAVSSMENRLKIVFK